MSSTKVQVSVRKVLTYKKNEPCKKMTNWERNAAVLPDFIADLDETSLDRDELITGNGFLKGLYDQSKVDKKLKMRKVQLLDSPKRSTRSNKGSKDDESESYTRKLRRPRKKTLKFNISPLNTAANARRFVDEVAFPMEQMAALQQGMESNSKLLQTIQQLSAMKPVPSQTNGQLFGQLHTQPQFNFPLVNPFLLQGIQAPMVSQEMTQQILEQLLKSSQQTTGLILNAFSLQAKNMNI